MGLLVIGHGAPFVEGVRRYETATIGEGAPEHAGVGGGFRAGVDRFAGILEVFGEVRDEAPLKLVEMALAGGRRITKAGWVGATFQEGG